jgi:protein-tyrosine phosphatase
MDLQALDSQQMCIACCEDDACFDHCVPIEVLDREEPGCVPEFECGLCNIVDATVSEPGALCVDCREHTEPSESLSTEYESVQQALEALEMGKKKKKNKSGSGSSGGGNWYASGIGFTKKVVCTHDGDTPVFAIGDKTFYGADSSGAGRGAWGKEAIIDCAGVAPRGESNFVESNLRKYRNLNTKPKREYIRLHWQDYGTPPVGRAFWGRLLNLLPAGQILICCMGSHGRTGTAMGALMVVSGLWTASEAIDYIRRNHCKEAVETQAQELYLEGLQDREQATKDITYLQEYHSTYLTKRLNDKADHYHADNFDKNFSE